MNEYFRASDPFPLQGPRSTRLARFYGALRERKLVTTSCTSCAARHWPPRVICPQCLSGELGWVELPSRGTIHAFTIQDTGVPPGFPRPLIFAMILVDGLRIFSRLVQSEVADVDRGAVVCLAPTAVARDPEGEVRYLPTFRIVTED